MILRPAIIGLCLAMAIVSVGILLQLRDGRQDPSLPPRLFPAFENSGESEPHEEFVLPQILVEIAKTPRTVEALPGGTVQYALTIRNVGDKTLHNLVAEERFDDGILSVVQGGSGSISKNRLAWNMDILHPGDAATFRYAFALNANANHALVQTTAYLFGDELMDMTSSSRMASSNIAVLSMPESGVEMGVILRWISSFIEWAS